MAGHRKRSLLKVIILGTTPLSAAIPSASIIRMRMHARHDHLWNNCSPSIVLAQGVTPLLTRPRSTLDGVEGHHNAVKCTFLCKSALP